jgi:hypothetical protein
MRRTFTRTSGRFKQGESRDYPKSIWKNIATSLKSDLDEFSVSDEVMVKNMISKEEIKRGPGRPRLSY